MKTTNPYQLNNVGENLYRSGLGTYFAIIKVGGKQIKRSLRTSEEALAKRRLREFKEKAERLQGAQQPNILFAELAQLWLASIRGGLKPSSYQRRVVSLNGLLPFFKGMPVKSVRSQAVEDWKIKRGSKLSARSFNIELETLNLIMRYAVEEKRLLLDNPVATTKRKKESKAKPVIPTKTQFTVLVKELRESPQANEAADLVEFLAYSGCRLGEAVEVRWQDVNFDLGTVLITGGELGTKNHEERTIPLFPSLLTLLERLQSDRFLRGDVSDNTAKLFAIQHSRQALISACKRLGLSRFGHHSMRHFFCSNAIEAGIDFKVIAAWLGHKDGGVLVAKTYGHLRDEHSAMMAKRMTFNANSESLLPTNVVRIAAYA